MLARYKIYRGKRPDDAPTVEGIRQDTRKHTQHCLRPIASDVFDYLRAPSPQAWTKFASRYLQILQNRFDADPTPFDSLAELAMHRAGYIGCSCPTAKNPDVNHCHTILALRFMSERYPDLEVELP